MPNALVRNALVGNGAENPRSRPGRAFTRRESGVRVRRDESFKELSESTGMKESNLTQYHNGKRGFARHTARFAELYRVRLDWLVRDKGPMKEPVNEPKLARGKVAVAGYVGAGAEVFAEDPYPKGRGMRMVDPPPGFGTDVVARLIRGDSMHPVLRDGWLIFYRRTQEGVPEECINQICVVRTEDGKTLCKELYRGSQAKRFNLFSFNAPLRENVKLEWAAKVIDIRPT